MFDTTSAQDIKTIKKILNDFMEASGMLVNGEKSNIYFFNTKILVQRHLARILGFFIGSLPSKYLSAPLVSISKKDSIWSELKEKINHRLSN